MIWAANRFLAIGFATLVVLLLGFGGWLVGATIKGAVVASGHVEVEKNRQIIQHPDGGIVDEIFVTEGQTVAQSDMLIRLNTAELSSEITVIENQLAELSARKARLVAERDNETVLDTAQDLSASYEPLFASQQNLLTLRLEAEGRAAEQLAQQSNQISRQIDGIDAQLAAMNEQLVLLDEELATQQSLLERGLSEAPRVLALRRDRAALVGQIAETQAARAVATERQSGIALELLSLATTRREEAMAELRDIEPRETELGERLRTLRNRLERAVIRAPLAGTVYDLQVLGASAVVRAAEPLMYLIPNDRPVVITAQIASRDIDQVYIGQAATVRFTAFDLRRTPELFGTVLNISADTFQDPQTGRSYYRIELGLDESEIDKLDADQKLIPGMPVETFLATRDQRPIDYLLKPLADYFTRAFREG